jgi:hypothetical protein
MTYLFGYMPNRGPVSGNYKGWNSLPRRRAGKMHYDYISADGNGPDDDTAVFPTNGDLEDLFRPPQGA